MIVMAFRNMVTVFATVPVEVSFMLLFHFYACFNCVHLTVVCYFVASALSHNVPVRKKSQVVYLYYSRVVRVFQSEWADLSR